MELMQYLLIQLIEVGQTLKVDGEEFEILGVGDVAEKNLVDLGHLTVHFSGDLDNLLPGAIVVEEKKLSSN